MLFLAGPNGDTGFTNILDRGRAETRKYVDTFEVSFRRTSLVVATHDDDKRKLYKIENHQDSSFQNFSSQIVFLGAK
jgi:hypothetical protein